MRPQKAIMEPMADSFLKSFAVVLPLRWSQPSGNPDGGQYNDSFTPEQKSARPAPGLLFLPATTNAFHVASAAVVSALVDAYIDGVTGAICSAIGQWMSAAAITGVPINGPTGTAPPGSCVGPPLFPLIMATAPKSKTTEEKHSKAIAQAVSDAWQAWQAGLTGTLNWPPTFAAFPGPIHPPTPNIPVPVASFSSAGEAKLAAGALKSVMIGNLGQPDANHHRELFEAVAKSVANVFKQWKPATLIQNILGVGPIPSFAPPPVPLGPVVGGVGNGSPGTVFV